MALPTLNTACKRERLSSASTPSSDRQRLLQILMAQDGSATHLCEVIASGPVSLDVVQQNVLDAAPDHAAQHLGQRRVIERAVTLHAHGQVMMDNLSYIAIDALPNDARAEIERGHAPLGHILAKLWIRKEFVAFTEPLLNRLWSFSGLPDPAAARVYRVHTQQGACMLIAETFRGGMLMQPAAAS